MKGRRIRQPSSSWTHYLNARARELPAVPRKQLARTLAPDWKALAPEVKQQYQDMYEYDKQRYRNDLAAAGDGAAAYIRPKVSAYMYFMRDRRGAIHRQNPTLSFGQISARVGAAWRELGALDKKPFLDLALADEQRYLQECSSARISPVRKRVRARARFVHSALPGNPNPDSTAAAPGSNTEGLQTLVLGRSPH